MFFPFRRDRLQAGSIRTLYAGVCINSDCNRIETALIGVQGSEAGSPVYLQKCSSFDLSKEVVDIFDTIREQVRDDTYRLQRMVNGTNSGIIKGPHGGDNIPCQETSFQADLKSWKISDLPVSLNLLRRKLSDSIEEALDDITYNQRDINRNQIRLTMIDGPDPKWFSEEIPVIPDIMRIAKRTGLTILSSLQSNEVDSLRVEPSHKENMFLLPYWIYLNQKEKNTVLIDLGKQIRLIRLPKSGKESVWPYLDFVETIPCGSLLDPLVYKASRGSVTMDQGGRLSVLGRNIPEVIEKWNELPSQTLSDFRKNQSNMDLTISCLNAIININGLERWSDYDLLCSAVHWIAERTATLVGEFMDDSVPNAIFIMGGGRLNALLYTCLLKEFLRLSPDVTSETNQHLSSLSVQAVDELGMPGDSFNAMAAAMLALLFDSNLPENYFPVTGQITTCPVRKFFPKTDIV